MSIQKLYDCIEREKINHSHSREAIYSVLLKSEECLTVSMIAEKLIVVYPRKVSINTIYRHLNLFVENGLSLVIQDDLKRSYYCLIEDKVMLFSICSRCNNIKKLEHEEPIECREFQDSDFITVHTKCHKCR